MKILFPEVGQQISQSASYPVLTVQDALAETLEGKITVLKNFTMGTASVTRRAEKGGGEGVDAVAQDVPRFGDRAAIF